MSMSKERCYIKSCSSLLAFSPVLSCGLLYLISKASKKARILQLVDLVKCKRRKLLKTKFSIGEGKLLEGRWMSLSGENWFCRIAKCCACPQSEKCFPIALLLTCVACSFRHVRYR